MSETTYTGLEVAVVGMAGRFPGARDVDEFWRNLEAGVESIRVFSDDELDAAGVPDELRRQPGYVPAGAALDDVGMFDARFFGYGPREAEIIDPQQRLFLEWSWQALEDAGWDPRRDRRPVGVWGGTDVNTYLLFHLMANPELVRTVGAQQLRYANRGDTLATRVAYAFDLTGPAVTVQTTCSTSLVAIHLACQSLLNGECDGALAGGVSVDVGQRQGYLFREGGVLSPDGHVRAFDAAAAGMVSGNGGGVVTLKRLQDALSDGDRVLAVIKGSAINNDGAKKVSYSAPGVDGQARVVRAAQVVADVEPESVSYVETHGTGTPLGDPIEVTALTRAFRAGTERRGFCAIGSVKTNIGHLDAGAGVAGFIKTVQALRHRRIPASLHFETPNPELDLETSPFRVAAATEEWTADGGPRRAGVSSLGIGGTNAHVILEEAPERPPSGLSREHQLLLVSARTAGALEEAAARLAEHLRRRPQQPLADVAWTLATGRRAWAHRAAVVAGDHDEAATVLAGEGDAAARRIAGRAPEDGERAVAFLLPGQGAQYVDMARGLYAGEEVFRRAVDRCAELLEPDLELDLRRVLYPAAEERQAAARELARTRLTQPALFAVEWALVRLLAAWGIEPAALLGHSLGEVVAATVAGVFELPDALALVAARGRMMEALPPGDMLSLRLSEDEVAPWLADDDDLALAAVNAPDLVSVSGPPAAVERLCERLQAEGHEPRRLHTSHAFHSPMMDPILDAFAERVSRVDAGEPSVPWISNLTGTWITREQAADPEYWARHLRGTVRFAAGAAELVGDGGRLLLETGPGRTLASLVRRQPGADGRPPRAVTTLRHPRDEDDDLTTLLAAVGRLWCAGGRVDHRAFFAGEERRTVGLPTYPFQRQRFWVEAPGRAPGLSAPQDGAVETAEDAGGGLSQHDRPDLSTVYVAPRDMAEERVAAVWETLLGVSGIGAFDDFFELGGHSLLATQVLSRVRDAFRVELPLKALFDAPTPAGVAAAIGELRATGAGALAPPLEPVPRDGELPLSFAQQRLWFLHRLEPESDAYNVPVAVRLEGDLRDDLLRRVLDEIVRRHEVLRTTFGDRDGTPGQSIHPPRPVDVDHVDLSHLQGDALENETRRLVAAASRRPFDLAAGPLLRATLLRRAARDHVAVLVMHHVVTDGWSMGLLVREIAALYRAFAAGEESPLPELPVQYADYAAWQRDWLTGEVLESKLDYWRRRLGAHPPVTELPTDRPRTPQRTWGGEVVRFDVGDDLAAELEAFGRRHGATLFMTLLAGFKALLGRYSAQDDLYVGTPVAGRNRSEIEELIGFFVNTLVLRTDLAGSPSFTTLVERVREASLEAHEHQEVPFERLVEELVSERSLSHTPLFQVFFVLQNVPSSRLELADVTLSQLPEETRSAKFDLSLQMEERSRGLVGSLEYATDLFDAATAERLAAHLQRLLAAAVAQPERPLAELPLLDAAERQQVVRAWNDTALELPDAAGPTLGELVARRAAATPDAPAVIGADGAQLSYGELLCAADALAARLAARGAGPETRVALLVERSPQALVALLAVLRAGAAFLPLDPAWPRRRIADLLDDAAALAVVTRSDLAERLDGSELPLLLVDAAQDDDTAVPTPAAADNPAWLIYTSGSTGRPKGVLVPHAAAVNHAVAMARHYGLTAGDRVLQFASLSFDAALEELFPTWHAGGAVVLRREAAALDFRELERQVEETGVTVLNLPTAYWHEWAAEMDAAEAAPPESVRLLVVGTEQALAERLAAWRRRAPEVRWINAYGPSETTVTATVWAPAADEAAPRVLIGAPVGNVTAHVVDRALQPVPVGVPGELVLGGAGLARGYLDRPAATAAAFVPDPFSGELAEGDEQDAAGARLYRTGDRVRRLPGGALEFLGRIDQQVKVRGFRVEVGEIEARLHALPQVRQAAVVVHQEAPGDRRLVACVAAADGAGDADDLPAVLRAALEERLPAYMVPAGYVLLDELPRTAGGKVDRRVLAARRPAAWGGAEPAERVAPRNPLEETLAAIWSEVLGVAEVGVHDNFFEIGGHSLKATQVVARVRRHLDRELPLRDMFRRPTVAGQAEVLAAADGEEARQMDKIRSALEHLDELSDEEVQELLARKKAALQGAAS